MGPWSRVYTGKKRAIRWAVNFVCANVSASLAALIFTIPLTAVYFNILTLAAPVSNLLAVPAAGWNFMAGFVTVLVGFVWLPAARVLGWVCFGLVRYVLWAAGLLASVPGHAVYFSNWFSKLLAAVCVCHVRRVRADPGPGCGSMLRPQLWRR